MLMLLALAAASVPPAQHGRVVAARSVTVRMRIARRPPALPPPPPVPMVEKRGPKCVAVADIAGTAVSAPNAVDFVLRGGARMRAKLESACPALDFYGGFYMNAGEGGRICADRDVIRTRAGGECGIERFRRLESPGPPKPSKP